MATVLVIKSSILGENSASNALIDQFVRQLSEAVPSADIIIRDFGRDPLPPLDATRLAALMTDAAQRDSGQQEAVALADSLIRELQAADLLILGAPMYNFTLPVSLKTWIDHVARAGVTFRYTETGPEGLLANKQVVVIATMGGKHEQGGSDHLRPYLRTALGLMGLNRIETITADGLNLGDEPRQRALGKARERLLAVADRVSSELNADNDELNEAKEVA